MADRRGELRHPGDEAGGERGGVGVARPAPRLREGGLAVRVGEEAEDVVQEALFRLWQRWAELDQSNLKAWLVRVTRNLCMDILRRRKFIAPMKEGSTDSEFQIEHQSPDIRLHGEQIGNELIRAIDELTEPQRSLVILKDIEGYAYQEIALALELSLEQVKVYLHRARRELRNLLKEYTHE